MDTYNIEEPTDLIKHSLNQDIYIKCRQNRELRGKLLAFDKHFNMMLQDVQETYTDSQQNQISRSFQILYMRGDTIILVSPITKKEAKDEKQPLDPIDIEHEKLMKEMGDI